MASRESKRFTAYVYENDYKQIQKLVLQYPEIETGGDLFGLWQNKNTVVIQLFIGPGKDCRRTTTSFHQDIGYLGKVGGVITTEEGLCNVGEWHSHHQIGMPNPSRNDNDTVLSNMPGLGLDRFVLFIASIEKKQKRSHEVKLDNIKIRCFIYKEGLPRLQQPIEGEIVQISGENPIQLENKALEIIKSGAGVAPRQQKHEAGDKKPKGSNEEKTAKRQQNLVRDENKSPNPRDMAEEKHKETNASTKPSQTTTQFPPSVVVDSMDANGFF